MARFMLLGEFLSTVNVLYGWSDVAKELKRNYEEEDIIYSIVDITNGSRMPMTKDKLIEFAKSNPVLGIEFSDDGKVKLIPRTISDVFNYMLARLKLAGVSLEYRVGTAVDPDLVVLSGITCNSGTQTRVVLPYGVSVLRTRQENIIGVKELILPDSCTIIEDKSINKWQDLKHVHLPKYVNVLGSFALYKCPILESIDMPEEIQNAGASCIVVKDSPIEANIEHLFDNTYFSEKIEIDAFSERNGIHNITIKISDKAPLSTGTLPHSIRLASDGVGTVDFSACKNLDIVTELDFSPDEYIRSMSPENITKVIFPESLRMVGSGAFTEVFNLELCEFPDSLQLIMDSAFYGLPEFTSTKKGVLSLPNTITGVKDRAFRGTAIKHFKLRNVKNRKNERLSCSFENECLSECENLRTVDLSCIDEARFGIGVFQGNLSMTDLVLPMNISSLIDGATSFSLFEGHYPIIDDGTHDLSLTPKLLKKHLSSTLTVTIKSGGSTEKYARERKLFPDLDKIGKKIEYFYI